MTGESKCKKIYFNTNDQEAPMTFLNPGTQKVFELLDSATITVMSPDKFDTEVTRLLAHGWTVPQIQDAVRLIILKTPHEHLAGALITKLRTAADTGIIPKPKPSQASIQRHFTEGETEYCMCDGHRTEHRPVHARDLPPDHPWIAARRKFLISPMLMRPTAW